MSLAIAGCLTLLAVAAPAMAMTASHIDYRWPDFIDAAARLQIEGELRALDIEPVAVATAEQVRIYQLRRVARLSDDRLALSPAPIGSDLSV
ncbi:hypothetical protein [Brevundimonas sp. UBA7664]|uniref:hypothetical protein n=1 Tax=Brevundimonas sp. UBA7664 TaxID=1946141 RepID=UPI0025BDEE0F|nr:hypothetical protein [Brevundimonas sp. UBA7664]